MALEHQNNNSIMSGPMGLPMMGFGQHDRGRRNGPAGATAARVAAGPPSSPGDEVTVKERFNRMGVAMKGKFRMLALKFNKKQQGAGEHGALLSTEDDDDDESTFHQQAAGEERGLHHRAQGMGDQGMEMTGLRPDADADDAQQGA